MFHNVAVNIGIQIPLMLLINSRDAAMSTKDDMIDKMGITHDGAKVHRMLQLHKTCLAVGSPPATFILYRFSRGACPCTRYARYGGRYHGLLRGPPFRRLHRPNLTPRGIRRGPPFGRLHHSYLTPRGIRRGLPSGRLHRQPQAHRSLRQNSSLLTPHS